MRGGRSSAAAGATAAIAAASLLAAASLALAVCQAPAPAPNRAALSVEVSASGKAGIGNTRPGSYGDQRYELVDYGRLPVVVEVVPAAAVGAPTAKPAARAPASLRAGKRDFDRELILVWPGQDLTITSERRSALQLFAYRADADGFDVEVPGGGSVTVQLTTPGRYQIACDDDERLSAEVVVAASPFARALEAGDDAAFDGLAPGRYTVHVHAPRLPRWSRPLTLRAGQRAVTRADLGVGQLRTRTP